MSNDGSRMIHYRVARNMFFVGLFVLVGKFAGAGKEMAIAYRFGVNEYVDAYLLTFTFVMWVPNIWASVATSTLIPISNSVKDENRSLFHSELSGWLISICIAIGCLGLLAIPVIANFLKLQFGVDQGVEFMLTCLIIAGAVSMLIRHYNALLLVQERHLNTLLNGVPALVVMASVLIYSRTDSFLSLSIGVLLGVLFHCMTLKYLLKSSDLLGKPRLSLHSRSWPDFRSAFGIMILSTIIMNSTQVIDGFVASSLGVGNVSKLGYSTRLLALFLGLGAISISRSILPILAGQDNAQHRVTLTIRWFVLLLFLGVTAALVTWHAAPDLVRLLYQRGAFLEQDTLSVSTVLRMGLLQLPFYFSGIVLVQYFTSMRLYWILFASSVLALSVKALTVVVLANSMGISGIALSTSLMYVATFIFLGIVFFLKNSKTNRAK